MLGGSYTFWYLSSTTCAAGRDTAYHGREARSTSCAPHVYPRIASVQVIVSNPQIQTLLLTLTLILEGRTSVSAVWHRCTQRFSQDARVLLRAFGYDHDAALLSKATHIHSNLRASREVILAKRNNLRASSVARTNHSSLSSNKAKMSSQLQNDNGSFADDEYVRQVLYPWDTQLHRHICGGVK